MKSSPQRHFERTALSSHAIVFLVFLVGLGVVLALNATRLYAANPGVKGAVALAVLLVLAWPRHPRRPLALCQWSDHWSATWSLHALLFSRPRGLSLWNVRFVR